MNQVSIRKLSNGIPLIINHNSNINTTGYGVFFNVGANFEIQSNSGISHFLEHMAFNGTEKRDSKAIREEISKIGGIINAYTGREVTAYHCYGLSEFADKFIEIVSENVTQSTFPESSIEKERNVILQEIAMIKDMPMHYIHDLSQEITFNGSSLGMPIIGPEDNIKVLNRDMIVDYVNKYYINDKMVVSVTTGLDPDKIYSIIDKHIGSYENRNPNIQSISNFPNDHSNIKFVKHESNQHHIALSQKMGGYYDNGSISKRHMSEKIFSNILGSGMNSRLFVKLREENGLCYNVASYIEGYKENGIFTIYVGTDKPQDAVDMIYEELQKPIETGEIEEALASLKTGITLKHENIHSSYDILANQYIKYERIISRDETMSVIQSIKYEDIEKVRLDVLNNEFYKTQIGPESIFNE